MPDALAELRGMLAQQQAQSLESPQQQGGATFNEQGQQTGSYDIYPARSAAPLVSETR